MNLVFLIKSLRESGGLERVLISRVNHWAQYRPEYNITIVTTDQPGTTSFFELNPSVGLTQLGIRFNQNESLTSGRNIRQAMTYYLKLRQEIRKLKPDWVINCIYGFETFFLPFIKQNARIISENHSSRAIKTTDFKMQKIKSFLRRQTENAYDFNIFLSQEEATAAGLDNSIIIPNPLIFAPERSIQRRENVILAAGRVCHVKGFDRLVEAWALINNRHPEWKVNIFGDGESVYLDLLNELIAKRGVQNSVTIYPATKDLAMEMMTSSIYAMASRTECFPMVLLESMQHGLPVVAFDCPTGPRNIVQNGVTGMLANNNNVEEFANKLSLLVMDTKRRNTFSKNAKSAVKQYSIERVLNHWEDLLECQPSAQKNH